MFFDLTIIGAGVIGLSIAKSCSELGMSVVVLEKDPRAGEGISSRNSGVIHAGIYYQSHTLKSKFCVEGNQLLYAYAKKFNVPYINTKKLIVANDETQIEQVFEIKNKAELNGVENLEILDEKQIKIHLFRVNYN